AGLPLSLQIAAAALIGCSVPLIGPLSRSRWVRLADGKPELTSSALSLDGIMDEVSFTAGPAVIGVLATLLDPAAGLLVAAALVGLPRRLRIGTALLLGASLPMLAVGSVGGLALAVGCLGVAIAPQMITMFGLVERTVPAGRLGEAMAALVSSITLAQSAGT